LIQKLLVANRGEIAVRVIRAARELGIRTVAVFASDDAGALFVEAADEARPLAGDAAARAYLDAGALCAAARAAGADAVHPGYGFLSESAAFARAVRAAGLVFVGPPPEAMERLGAKAAAKEIAASAGVPTVPWVDLAGLGAAAIRKAAKGVGYPLLVKASAGGGGRGMRLVEREAELLDAVRAGRDEAAAAFGDGHVFLERRLVRPRHVEVQVLADAGGRVVALPERECSIQRRHQKLIEESPSPAVGEALRGRLEAAAVAIAETARYENVGTVEFLVDANGAYTFLEVNARLQVEHPVTEAVTGLDLVAWQLRIASGERIPDRLADLAPCGHAIECRVHAEDPASGFLPVAGRAERFVVPAGPGVRVDTGLRAGDGVSTRYDSLVAKLIVHAEDRPAAVARMAGALRETILLGFPSNLGFLRATVDHPAFRRGETSTAFLEEQMADLVGEPAPAAADLVAIALFEAMRGALAERSAGGPRDGAARDPWSLVRGFRSGA
jgi:acetyl/propionyl-CoA carboxylase alpha subunit